MGLCSSSRASVASALLLCFCITLCICGVQGESRRLYIVYLGDVKHGHPNHVVASHHDLLATVLGSKEDSLASITHNYKHGFSGFSAMLTEDQAKQLAEFPEVISVELSRMCTTATTRSWDFLGLNYQMPRELLRKSKQGEDVIIGIIDTGIWPESKSFSDEGYVPVLSRWKGKCEVGQGWNHSTCNRKIIGARFYSAGVDDEILKTEYLSARDYDGHGTYTASTAAGSVVEAAGFHGLAAGAARGGALRARIAVYKSVWGTGSRRGGSTATVLAAIDDAIHDGVDVLSLSLGFLVVKEFSFGALHAVQKGITVVFSAGNDGPRPQTVGNTAPWVITVAASTIDRSFPTVITLGNRRQITGQSFYYRGKNSSGSTFRSLASGLGGLCTADALNGTDLKGKIALCFPSDAQRALVPISEFQSALQNVRKAGGSGLVFAQYTTNFLHVAADCKGKLDMKIKQLRSIDRTTKEVNVPSLKTMKKIGALNWGTSTRTALLNSINSKGLLNSKPTHNSNST